jgi:succinate-acetate transporter protein
MSATDATNHDTEKGALNTHSSHEGGAVFNRNITPGGHALDSSQPAFPVYHRKFANPAPLGLCAFALTTFVLSLINVGTLGVSTPNVVVGLALGYGGLVQLLAGMWEFAAGNTFGATAFSSYGGFWISFGLLISPWSGIGSAYTVAGQFEYAIGFYLMGWFIFTFIMLIASLRSSVALSGVFFFLTLTFMLLGISKFVPAHATAIGTAGGALGLVTAFNAWYVAAAGLLTPDTSYFVLPVGNMAKRD